MEDLHLRFYKARMEEFFMESILLELEIDRADFLDNVDSLDFDWVDNNLVISVHIDMENLNEIKQKILTIV